MYPAGNLFIPISHGRLETIYRPKSREAEKVALMLHPHPLFQGTMHNKVVFRAAKALEESGYETIRINFRGVGLSTGVHDNGMGECEDAITALEYLLKDQPFAKEVIVGGFSFGSIVALKIGCNDTRVNRIISIGTPVRMGSIEFVAECKKPKLFIHGAQDDTAHIEPLEDFLRDLPANNNYQYVRIEDAGHFFDNQANELKQAIKDFVK